MFLVFQGDKFYGSKKQKMARGVSEDVVAAKAHVKRQRTLYWNDILDERIRINKSTSTQSYIYIYIHIYIYLYK